MKKVLFVATVDSHIRHFHIPFLKYFKEKGYEVHVATANNEKEIFEFCDKKHTISFERSPLKRNNLKAIGQMKKLLREENFAIVHCHTPMGSVVTRLAARKARKNGTKVLYTAHGFHFFQGASWKNWMIFYPVEKWLSRVTDVLITINEEDFAYAKKFHAKRVEKIDGIGVDAKRFQIILSDEEKERLRAELGISKEDIVLTYVAEFIPRKNQTMLIEAMKQMTKWNDKVKLLLVGTGILKEQYEMQIQKLGLQNNVILTGYRKDVPKIFQITDIGVSTSTQEGLPVNLVEAQMSGLPCVATNVRGNNEVIVDGENGFLVCQKEDLITKLEDLIQSPALRESMGRKARESVKKYEISHVQKQMQRIYESLDNC